MDLDLKIIPVDDKVVLLAESFFGEATTQIDSSFFSDMIERSKILRKKYSGFKTSEELEQEIEKFGRDLFSNIFKDEILALFYRTWGGSLDGKINLRLMLAQANYNIIYWEIMRFRDEYIAFQHNLIRHPFISRPVKSWSQTRNKLHIFVVAVDTYYPDGSLIKEEFNELNKLFSSFEEQHKIRLSLLYQEEATLNNIKDILFEGVDVWHFIGHGSFNENNPQESSLAVWPEGEGKSQVGYDQLSIRWLNALAMNNNIGFSFLNACKTAYGTDTEKEKEVARGRDSFVSMAHSLIKTGVPIVIATNHNISNHGATLLSKRFYRSIIKYGKPVDRALKEARAELFVERGNKVVFSDWFCPALYARSRSMEIGTGQLQS